MCAQRFYGRGCWVLPEGRKRWPWGLIPWRRRWWTRCWGSSGLHRTFPMHRQTRRTQKMRCEYDKHETFHFHIYILKLSRIVWMFVPSSWGRWCWAQSEPWCCTRRAEKLQIATCDTGSWVYSSACGESEAWRWWRNLYRLSVGGKETRVTLHYFKKS